MDKAAHTLMGYDAKANSIKEVIKIFWEVARWSKIPLY
jgi:hypothetical protein